MFSRSKGLFIVTILVLLGVAFLVRAGQAQKSPPAKTTSAGHAKLGSTVPIVGRALRMVDTRPGKFKRALSFPSFAICESTRMWLSLRMPAP